MDLEKELFKRFRIDFDKLENYGFTKRGDKYCLSRNMMDETFRVEIEVDLEGNVVSEIYDLNFNTPYTNHRVKNQNGEFVGKVREELTCVLLDVRNKCFIKEYFIGEQANQVCNLIKNEYGDEPEYLWDDYPNYGVFRNSISGKWYGIIMNIPRNRVDKGDEEVEVLNIKLGKEEIPKLLEKQGFYPAYHMNKKYWISIILDGTLDINEIMKYICESHENTRK